ncbi:MAG: phosphoenolpyruvate--protein phosphotransferase, partial [Gammaproteobacteria bacterium]
ADKRVFRRIERKIGEAAEQRNQQWTEDVRDLGRRILRALAGVASHPLEKIPRGSILVAKYLLPSDTVHLSRQSAAGVVVESAGAGSHAALLTRELGIPMVAQIAGVLDEIQNGDTVLVDGLRGAVVVSPDEDTGKEFAQHIDSYHSDVAKAKAVCREPATTGDGVSVTVMANVGDLEDVEFAAENGADGIGLYRVEQIYLSRNEPPSEEELYEAILKSLDPLPDKPVTIRLLDVGGDKQLSYISHRHEENPFLGRRGVRLLLDYPELTSAQLKVCLRLSRDREIHILVPMITLAEEMGKIRGMYLQAAKEAGIESPPPLGAMLETPAAALSVKEIAQHADFFSIGTNDLTQYTLAAGRENPRVADYFIETHPVIMRLLEIIVTDAGDTPLEICGELAGYPNAIPSLVQLGICALSVAPPLVPFVKQAVRQANAVTSPAASSSN